MAKDATQPRRQRSFVWLQGLLCGALATLATPTALLLGVLLAPALLAIALDQDPGRPRARSIALFSMAASVGPLRTPLDLGSQSVHSDRIADRSKGGWDSMERRSRGLAADRDDAACSARVIGRPRSRAEDPT